MLTHHLPGLDSALQQVQGPLIATHIGEVTVNMRKDRDARALELKADEEKRIPYLLGSNLTYRLRLVQVDAHNDLLPCGRNLRGP